MLAMKDPRLNDAENRRIDEVAEQIRRHEDNLRANPSEGHLRMIAEAEHHGRRRGSWGQIKLTSRKRATEIAQADRLRSTTPGSTSSPDRLEASEVATEWDDQSRTTAPSTAYARSTATSSTTTQGTAISAGHPQGDGGRINVDAEASHGQATEIARTEGRARYELIRLPRKFDPRDGRAYTFDEISERYKAWMTARAIKKLWKQLAPATDHWLI